MVNICHVTSVHDTKDVRIFKKECISLAKENNFAVCLVGPGVSDEIINNVKIIGCGERPASRLKRMTSFSGKVIKNALKLNADIYHLHDPELLRYALTLKKKGKKVIFDSHENILESIDEKTYLPTLIRRIFKKYYAHIQKKVLPRLDGIIVVSPQMIDTYKNYNSNVVLICNFPIINDEVLNYSDTFERGRFVFAGGISEQWSHREIINVINSISGAKYYLYGIADEEYVEGIKKLPGWGRVHFGGRIPFEQAQEEIRKSEAVFAILKPSKNSFFDEGTLGNTKLFEAMANGRPVIASNFKIWQEIVKGNDCGICVDPNDETAIASAIEYLLNCDEKVLETMGKNGIKAVKEKYNWKLEEKKLLAFYNNIVRKGK